MRVWACVKGPRLLLVSDAVALAGMPPGVCHDQVAPARGQAERRG